MNLLSSHSFCRETIFRRPFGVASAVLFFVVALSFSLVRPLSTWAANLAQVNGVGIPASDVTASIRIYLKQIGHDTLSPDRLAVLKHKVLKRHIEEELLYQEAEKRALSVSDDEVRLAVSQIKGRFISEEAYETALVRETLKPEDIWSGARRSALIQKVWHVFSDMSQEERTRHLSSLSQNAKIVLMDPKSTEANLNQGVD